MSWNERALPKAFRDTISGQAPTPPPAGYPFELDAVAPYPTLRSASLPPAPYDDAAAFVFDPSLDAASIKTYATVADVAAAISGGQLVNGQHWRVAWVADTYHGTGDTLGRVVQGVPSWRGVVPWPAIGGSASVDSSSGSASLSAGVGGRPLLSVTASLGEYIEANFDLKTAPPRGYRVFGQLQIGASASNSSGVIGAYLRRFGDNLKYVMNFLKFESGQWQAGSFFRSSLAESVGALSVAPTDASKFVTALPVSFNMGWPLTGAQPAGVYKFDAGAQGSSSATSSMPVGEGDFTIANQSWEPLVRLHSTGAAASFLVTGIELETRV